MKLKREQCYKWVSFLLLAGYGAIMLGIYIGMLSATVPDEEWFFSVVKSIHVSSLSEFFHIPNYLGYGSIYWMILFVAHDFIWMRVLSWICLMIVPLCLILYTRCLIHREWRTIFFAVVLYLSCPLSWFTGKIIGPELMGQAMGCVGLILMSNSVGNISSPHKNACSIMGGYWQE